MDENVPPLPGAAAPPPLPPPPLNAPPPVIMPPPRAAEAPRRGRAWKIAAILLMVVLVFSLLGNFSQLTGNLLFQRRLTKHREMILQEIVVEDNDAKKKIAVVDVEGIIMSGAADRGGESMVKFIQEQLKIAKDDADVKAVILRVDSPGGEVLAADEIYNSIKEFQRKSGKPVIASMGSLAASGGYYVSAPCQWIVANDLTITGSIGVIMHGLNYRGLMDKIGLRPEVYKSGKFKDMLSPDKKEEEITPEERKMVQDLIEETFGRFKDVVAEGREDAHKKHPKGQKLSAKWQEYADGRILSGKQAYELGFVDDLGNFDKAVERAKELANFQHGEPANLIEYRIPFDLSNLFRLFGKSEAQSIKVELGGNAPKLQRGHLYFLLPTVL
jgi:protease-4